MERSKIFLLLIGLSGLISCDTLTRPGFESSFPENIKRHWIGQDNPRRFARPSHPN